MGSVNAMMNESVRDWLHPTYLKDPVHLGFFEQANVTLFILIFFSTSYQSCHKALKLFNKE